MIDMSNQLHINIKQGQWPRCRDVTLRDGVLECRLDCERTYTLIEAYRRAPHVQFANATTDRDLIAFVRRWGPFGKGKSPNLTWEEWPQVVYERFSLYRTEQRWFRALMGLLHASRRAEKEFEALCAFIEAAPEQGTEPLFLGRALQPFTGKRFSIPLSQLRAEFHIEGPILDWIKNADLRTIRAARACMIPYLHIGVGAVSTHIVCGRRHIEAGWSVYDLRAALDWMVWYDLFNKFPLICCPECGKVKRATVARANRKFCSYKCAHRASARIWQRDYNKRKRAERRAQRKGR